MKLMVLAHLFPYPLQNGGRIRALNLIRELARQYSVVALAPESSAEDLAQLQALLPAATVETAPWQSAREPAGVAYLSPLPRGVYRPTRLATSRVEHWLEGYRPDVLLATDPVLGEYLRPHGHVCRAVDIAAEYTRYGRSSAKLAGAFARPLWWLRVLKWDRYMRSLGGLVDLWTVPSEPDRQALRGLVPANVRIDLVPNGADLEATPFSLDLDAPPRVVHCGPLDYPPNRDALHYFCTEIWPLVIEEVPKAELFVTGEARRAPDSVLKAPGVVLTGHLPEVRTLLRSARVSVVPLRTGAGTRLKILEAMAAGTPVVSSSVGAEGLAVTDGENILLADSPRLFAERVVQLLRSDELRSRVARAGRGLVEAKYDWTVIGGTLRAAVAEVVCPQPV